MAESVSLFLCFTINGKLGYSTKTEIRVCFSHTTVIKRLEKNVNSEKLGNALSKSKDLAINLLGNMLYRTRVESIRDADGIKGLKARWIGDEGQNVIEINTPSGNADIRVDSETAPTVEYVQEGERRTVAVKHINNLSCELSRETMDRIATPRGAGIAMCIGAGIGLLGWFVISAARALSAPQVQQIVSATPPLASSEDSEQSEGTGPETDEDRGS